MTDPAAASPRVDGIMLKFLTHKLRSHSLNEDPNQEKVDDDHDSGTESDDEFQNDRGDIANELSTAMDSLEEASGGGGMSSSEGAWDSALPSDVDLGASPSSSSFGLPASTGQIASSSSGCSSTETPPIEQSYEFLLQHAQSDQHSSEEELEVINGPKMVEAATAQTAVLPQPRKLLSVAPEKRKWSEANSQQQQQQQQKQQEQQQFGDNGDGSVAAAYSAPVSRTGREPSSGSSDEEGLCYSRSGSAISQPVQFRSSPPSDAHKPVRSLSPPPKLFHASAYSSALETRFHPHRPRSRPRPHSQYHSHTSLDHHHHHQHHFQLHHSQQQQDLTDIDVISACSPRKRHRPPHRLPRPCLDFEKMQQMKTKAVTTWRHTNEHGKELSVFCW